MKDRVIYLEVFRGVNTPHGNFGSFFVDDVMFSRTLELNEGQNRRRIDAIPPGDYPVVMQKMRTKFQSLGPLPLILDVPGRDGIFIHPANWISELNGCISLGDSVIGNTLRNSVQTIKRLQTMLVDAYGITIRIHPAKLCNTPTNTH